VKPCEVVFADKVMQLFRSTCLFSSLSAVSFNFNSLKQVGSESEIVLQKRDAWLLLCGRSAFCAVLNDKLRAIQGHK